MTMINPNGKTLTMVSNNNPINLIDLQTLQTHPQRIHLAPQNQMSTMHFFPNEQLTIADKNKQIAFTDPRTNKLVTQLPHQNVPI